MRSLYARLLLALLAVLLLSTYAFYLAYRAVTGPNIVRMIDSSQLAQSAEAAAALQAGGSGSAAAYLSRLDAVTQMPHYLVDANGRDVVTAEDRSSLLRQRFDSQRPLVSDDHGRAVFVTPAPDGIHRLITLAPPLVEARAFIPYVTVITGAVMLLFWLLVAHVVRPMRQLAHTVQRFGRGELAARAAVRRQDEIGQLAASFNDMAARIETLVTSERRLLQDVSHELRSPLTRLNIGIELLRTATDRDQAADRIQREAGRLSDLVATLLEVARLEGDPASTPLVPLNVADVLRESVDSCAAEAEPRKVSIHLEGCTSSNVPGNWELLRRAFENIIGNAARYAPPKTVVTVTCASTADDYEVTVRDSGPGVREDQLAKLGSAFYRTDESRSAETGGTGLGLAIARRAIQLHRGTIEFRNADPGLSVVIRLPHSQHVTMDTRS
ncbi:MAG: HAMP domain-containing sensor histidine kinase [Vicinamibacterales bacterium]